MNYEEGIGLAIEEAKQAYLENEVPVGAVLVLNDIVISKTHNLCLQRKDPTQHAELLALQDGLKHLDSLSACTLFVTLEPCAMCAGAAAQAGLGRLVFGAYDNNEGCCGSLIDLTDHWISSSVVTVGGIRESECSELLSLFFQNKR